MYLGHNPDFIADGDPEVADDQGLLLGLGHAGDLDAAARGEAVPRRGPVLGALLLTCPSSATRGRHQRRRAAGRGQELTLDPSEHRATMRITRDASPQTMCQKSSTVDDSGPCAAI